MADDQRSVFRRWLNAPLFSLPATSSQVRNRVEKATPTVAATVGIVVLTILVVSGIEAAKQHGWEWLAIAVAAIGGFLSSRFAIPVLLVLILFALWGRSASIDALQAQIADLSERIDDLEERSRPHEFDDDEA